MHCPQNDYQNLTLADHLSVLFTICCNYIYKLICKGITLVIDETRLIKLEEKAESNLAVIKNIIRNGKVDSIAELISEAKLNIGKETIISFEDEVLFDRNFNIEFERSYHFFSTNGTPSNFIIKNYIDEVDSGKEMFEVTLLNDLSNPKSIFIYLIKNEAKSIDNFINGFLQYDGIEVDVIADTITIAAPIINPTNFNRITQKLVNFGNIKFNGELYNMWGMNTLDSIQYRVD